MEMNKQPFALPTICKRKSRIDPTPDYQRPPAWSRKQKQLLMDTILRNYDIPKFYWRKVNRDDGIEFEVIDGQQRLRAIWEFSEDEYPLAKDSDPIDGIDVAGLKFSSLPMKIADIFDTYSLDIVVITDAVEDEKENEVRDMFLRLQNGTTLKAQEKRNAMVGAMRDFIRELAEHPFFKNCKFKDSRFTFQHVAAQITLMELNGGATNVKDVDLNRMYKKNENFNHTGAVAKKIKKTLDFLIEAFPEKTPELERYNVITLYALSSLLIDKYIYNNAARSLASWFIAFEGERAQNELADENDRDTSLIEYRRMTSQSTDAEESIKGRLEIMEKRFFQSVPNLELKDPTRGFSPEQRLAIFRRDNGVCQVKIKCSGDRVTWDNWHADHIQPYSTGGKTVVDNGQIACVSCNLSKGANFLPNPTAP